jgi:predicted nuclease with TOPRIM domain
MKKNKLYQELQNYNKELSIKNSSLEYDNKQLQFKNNELQDRIAYLEKKINEDANTISLDNNFTIKGINSVNNFCTNIEVITNEDLEDFEKVMTTCLADRKYTLKATINVVNFYSNLSKYYKTLQE